jgi:hypothetical protein
MSETEEWELFALLISLKNENGFEEFYSFFNTFGSDPLQQEQQEIIETITNFIKNKLRRVYLINKRIRTILELKYDDIDEIFTGYIKYTMDDDINDELDIFKEINNMEHMYDTDKLLIDKDYKDINEILPLKIKEHNNRSFVKYIFINFSNEFEKFLRADAVNLFNSKKITIPLIDVMKLLIGDATKINNGGRKKKRKTKRNKKRNRRNKKKSKRFN